MKRISRIEIENARAYYDRLIIPLEKGENLLLYGENGSGKTSLYKSLNEFIQSFYTKVDYTPNRYKQSGDAGEVKLRIGDFDQATRVFTNELDYRFGKGTDNTNVQDTGYLKALAQAKGFLNYRDLLAMYLVEEDNPNLFNFFVEHLLKNHIPIAQGGRITLLANWKRTWNDIMKVHNRNELRHKRGKEELVAFEASLRSVLDNLFAEVNRYLTDYFPNLILSLGYELKPMQFSYGTRRGKANWSIERDLRLKVSSGRAQIQFYTEGLNEARLSAIAICIYLAALRENAGSDLRLMFLDDIFIGIDSSNRTPILKILNQEFQDFQIIVATYDRSWYCLAEAFLKNDSPDAWKFVSLFARPKHDHGLQFIEPVMVTGDSLVSRAKQYLHGGREIDLPAAANYFRKSLEELLSEKHLPKQMFLGEDFSLIPGYKLKYHIAAVSELFAKVGMDLSYIHLVSSYLHPLIHPLSHYDDEAPVYRSELMDVEKAIAGLTAQVDSFPHKCRLLEGKGNVLCVQYDKADGSYKSKYFVELMENLWLFKDDAGNVRLADCKCKMIYMEGEENGVALTPYPVSRNTKMRYTSLDDALQQVYDYEVNVKNHNVIPSVDYDIVFTCEKMKVKKCIQVRRDALLRQM